MFSIPDDVTLIPSISEDELRNNVQKFLTDEPGWIANTISNDPALSSKPRGEALKEVLLYQGLHALAIHRQAHALYREAATEGDERKFYEARSLSQAARRLTGGIEIHPGAKIGRNFFIDHGAGVVIGETCEIGDDVMLYHRITLGSDGSHTQPGERRHPKLGNRVTICTGAEILGAVTVGDDVFISAGTKVIGDITIGNGARIAPGLIIRHDVPENATVKAVTSDGRLIFDEYSELSLGWEKRIQPRKPKMVTRIDDSEKTHA